MRFFIAMFSHETNTFSTIPTDQRQFEARDLRYGGEILEAYRGTGTCLGGMIDAAAAHGVTLVPSLAAAASPAGRVTADFYRRTTQRLLEDLRAAGALDGILLDLHGAMVPESTEDGEGDLLRAVREAVGASVPVAVTLDFHANVTADMVRHATLLHGYKTYPHVDMDARGREATERLLDVAAGRIRPTVAWRQPPLLPPIAGQLTARGPMRRLYDLAAEMEKDPTVVSISIFAGFPLADIKDAGLSIYVAADGNQRLADELADRLAALAWEHRREFLHTAVPVGEAVARALAADGRPVILADIADNTGGGAAGDTTEILRELLRVGARQTTVACLWDAEAVQACIRAGVGATVAVRVGGKVDPSHGAPIEVTGRVRTLSDGRFVHKGPMFRGLEGRLGPTAVLDVNDLKIILISLRWQTLDPEMLRFVGIDPTAEKILVVKSSVHYRAAFEPLAHAIIEVDAPGLSSSNLARFTFKRVRRPIYPLDAL
ncbi:MAG: M81 family metallopeptidase [Candidatus Rokubacteria bacterium]|nr:M81 family metallopeptidase [Candidatus Rokubacteria bacterium]